MMSKFFKNKKVKFQKPVEPRVLDDITKELNQECWALGQLEYQVYVLKQAVEEKNRKIQQLNYEGNTRKNLDAEAAKKQAPPVQATT